MTGYSASPVISARVFAGSCRSYCLSDSAILRWVAKVWASPSFMWLVPLGVSAVKTGATTRGSLKTQAFAFVAWAAQAWHKKCRSKIYSLQTRCSTPKNFVHVLSEAQESSSCHLKLSIIELLRRECWKQRMHPIPAGLLWEWEGAWPISHCIKIMDSFGIIRNHVPWWRLLRVWYNDHLSQILGCKTLEESSNQLL